MSAAFPGHERADSSAVRNPAIPQMEHATQSKSDRRPIAGNKGTVVATAQANAADDESPGTSGASLGSRQDTRAEAKEVNRRSLDYVLRSGCAGGMAGCAVSANDALRNEALADCLVIGKDGGCALGPGEDPVPSVESSICEIYRKLVWSFVGDEGYLPI